MCGIAGIMSKTARRDFAIGKALIAMLDGCQHRGQDSTGFALYHDATPGQLQLRLYLDSQDAAAVNRIQAVLAEHCAEIIESDMIGNNYRLTVAYDGEVQPLAYAIERVCKVISIGTSLEIVKDVGTAHDVDARYHVGEHLGSHGIGHVRLATESDVRPEAAHPFWATGFADVAIVHNGQITNYWKMRRRLEQQGYQFCTNNDSELIAVFLAEQMSREIPLRAALEAAIDKLDGTFSFLVSTRDELGFAKDRLAAKPMIMLENDELIAIASEEVSLNRMFPGQALNTYEPLPGTYATWSKST